MVRAHVFRHVPAVRAGTIGLSYLAEHVGWLIEVRRHAKNSGARL
jgi:hypothetical protein